LCPPGFAKAFNAQNYPRNVDLPVREGEDGQVIYQIYTQDLPRYRRMVVRVLKENGFAYFTISPPNAGYGPDQNGKQEDTMMIWVAVENYSWRVDKRMARVAECLCEHNGPKGQGQSSVLLVRIPAYPKLVKKRRRASCNLTATVRRHCGPSLPAPRASRGKVMAAAGDWATLLPQNAELRGKIVRFLPE
jgi:hypothetical protein